MLDANEKIPGMVITVSDRCSLGKADDRSGPRAVSGLAEFNIECAAPRVVPDEIPAIRQAIQEGIDSGVRVIFTTGGTGVTPRDVTPEATRPFIESEIPGVAEQIRAYGLQKTPLAGLSRGLVGVTERSEKGVLIINAPGSTGGVKDTIAVIGPLVHHILSQISGGNHD